MPHNSCVRILWGPAYIFPGSTITRSYEMPPGWYRSTRQDETSLSYRRRYQVTLQRCALKGSTCFLLERLTAPASPGPFKEPIGRQEDSVSKISCHPNLNLDPRMHAEAGHGGRGVCNPSTPTGRGRWRQGGIEDQHLLCVQGNSETLKPGGR